MTPWDCAGLGKAWGIVHKSNDNPKRVDGNEEKKGQGYGLPCEAQETAGFVRPEKIRLVAIGLAPATTSSLIAPVGESSGLVPKGLFSLGTKPAFRRGVSED